MEEIIKAIVFGAVQGLTEFIPISSTAHLRVVPALLGWKDEGAAFSAVIQMGTLLSTLIYFRKDIVNLTRGFIASLGKKDLIQNPESRIFLLITIGTIPIGICGLLFKGFIEGDARGLYVISSSLILLAIVLFLAEKKGTRTKNFEDITVKDGIIIGLAQALALIPGSSRSGVTITAGLFRGLKRDVTARYSFLLSIPAIGLSGLYELYSEREQLLKEDLVMMLVATAVSAVVGYAAIAFLIRYLKTHSNLVFIIYRILLGITILTLLAQGVLSNLE